MLVDHCVEPLRLTLMCHGDTTPYLIELDPEEPDGARADFSAHHRCRRFDPLVEWMSEHSTRRIRVTIEEWASILLDRREIKLLVFMLIC